MSVGTESIKRAEAKASENTPKTAKKTTTSSKKTTTESKKKDTVKSDVISSVSPQVEETMTPTGKGSYHGENELPVYLL